MTTPVTSRTVGVVLRAMLDRGELDLPRPGSGQTLERWQALAEIASRDLVLARLAEGHVDAIAILHELGCPVAPGLWGVWAAEPPTTRVTALQTHEGWVLEGTKGWCSGAAVVDHALVTGHAEDGRRLFAVSAPSVRPVPGSWPAVGMQASGTLSVVLTAAPATAVGAPLAYLERPGFWHGGAGVAACWFGGAVGVARTLLQAVRDGRDDPHTLAHLGAVDAVLHQLWLHLEAAAAQIDADPHGPGARLRAQRVRACVEAGATEVLDRVGRALGAGPLCLDAHHAHRVADLTVYLRQSHAERDLAGLGDLAAREATW